MTETSHLTSFSKKSTHSNSAHLTGHKKHGHGQMSISSQRPHMPARLHLIQNSRILCSLFSESIDQVQTSDHQMEENMIDNSTQSIDMDMDIDRIGCILIS